MSVVGCLLSAVRCLLSGVCRRRCYGGLSRIELGALQPCWRGDLGRILVALDKDDDRITAIAPGHGLIGVCTSGSRHARLMGTDLAINDLAEPFTTNLNLRQDEHINALVPLIKD